MSIFNRAWAVTEAKINALLDKLENPNETLDLSYEKMLEGLQQIKIHLADVMTEQKRLENKISAAKETIAQREDEAKAAIKMKEDDLAREALNLKQQEIANIAELQKSLTQIVENVTSMKAGEKKFQQRIEKFRNQKEITKATYTAAQTQTKISESLSGISDDFGGIGRAMTQAKDKTEQMQARSQAVNTLSEEGVLKDPLDDSDSTTTKLNDIRNKSAVEDELEKLKKQMDSDTKN